MATTVATAGDHTAAAEHHHDLGFIRTYIFTTDHKMIAKQYLCRPAGPEGGMFAGLVNQSVQMQGREKILDQALEVVEVHGGWFFGAPERALALTGQDEDQAPQFIRQQTFLAGQVNLADLKEGHAFLEAAFV